jgi:hypothetical protein
MSYIGNQPSNTSFLSDTFSGNGTTTVFTMAVAPANTAAVIVAIWGVLQDPTTYGVVGRILTFSQAPPTGTGNISVRYLALPASNVTTTAYRSVTEFTATAGQTTFTPASYTPGFISVFRSGVRLGASNFTATNGVTVVLSSPAIAGDLITIESFFVSAVLNAIPNVSGAISSSLLDTSGQVGSGAMIIPTGTTAQRPASPTNGMIRKNTTTGYVEYWDPATSSWIAIGAFSASGGVITTAGGNTIHTFTSSGVFTVSAGSSLVNILVVAGGGGGGGTGINGGGGGGGGGVVFLTTTLTAGTYSVVVGSGGNNGATGSNGGTSQFGSFTAAIGGGGGGGFNVAGNSGGSGGGRGRDNGTAAQTNGTSGQGFAGGAAGGTTCSSAGGGGGAGAVGFSGGTDCAPTARTGNISAGGVGASYSISGSSTFYSGGGGGAFETNNATNGGAPGGNGGGGRGSLAAAGVSSTAGTTNSGGGGGGGQNQGTNQPGSNGGSGIVIISYATL